MKVREFFQYYRKRYNRGLIPVNFTKFSRKTLSEEPYAGFADISEVTDEIKDRELVDFDIHLNSLWISID